MPNLKIRLLLTQECGAGCPFCYCNFKDDCVVSKEIIDRVHDVALALKQKHGFRGIRFNISGGDVFQEKNLPTWEYILKKLRPISSSFRSASINPHHSDKIIDFVIRNRIPVLVSVNVDDREDRMLNVACRLMAEGLLVDNNIIIEDINLKRFLPMTENFLKHGLPVRAYSTYDPRQKVMERLDIEGYFDLLEKYNYNHINSCFGHYQPWRAKPPGGSCGFCESFFAVTPRGNVLACYPLQFDKRNEPVGEPCGSILDDKDPIEMCRDHAKRFGYTKEYEDSCSECEYLVYCRSGCRANKFYINGKYDGLNTYCSLNKYVIGRIKKLYSKLDWAPVEKLGWKVLQEERGTIPINLSTLRSW